MREARETAVRSERDTRLVSQEADSASGEVDVCLSKNQYPNARIAAFYAKKAERRSGIVHRVYKCTVCYYHHLSTGGFVGQDEEEA